MAQKKNRGLGRGLGAIIGEVSEAYENSLNNDGSSLVLEISVANIKPNPYQPRKNFDISALQELADSIKEHGLLQPVIVCEDENNEYVLIAGERRLRASKLAGLDSIRAIVADIKFDKMRELALIENIQREELNPIELAQSYKELIDEYNITHEELSTKIKKSRTQITNTLRLLNLELFVQEYLIESKITQGHAKLLVTLSPKEQRLITDSIIGQKLSVRESEALIKNLKNGEKDFSTQRDFKESKSAKKNPLNRELLQKAQKMLLEKDFKASIKDNQLCIKFSKDVEITAFLEKFH